MERKGCVEPARGPIIEVSPEEEKKEGKEEVVMEVLAKVGKPAPDFEANALIGGEFKNVKLSDYKGKWVVLCFYPADFTFV